MLLSEDTYIRTEACSPTNPSEATCRRNNRSLKSPRSRDFSPRASLVVLIWHQ